MFGLNQNSSPSLELVKTALDKIRDQASMENTAEGKAEATDALIFTQDTATNAAVVSTVIGGGGYFEKTLDDVAINRSSAVSAPTPKTTLIANFKKDLPISRTFMADQQQSAVTKAVRQQTATWMASRDRNAFNVYALGFTTQNTIDGVTLFSNSHVSQNGDTVDNLESGALADDTLNTSVVSLRGQLSQTGVTLGYDPKFMLTSSTGHNLAMRTTKSVLRAGSGNNDLNYYSEMYPGMIVKFSPFLDATSTTAYFLGTSMHGVVRFEREAFFTKLTPWEQSDNDTYKYKMRAREEVDSIEYSGLLGSTGQ